jgi:hypothetical protein
MQRILRDLRNLLQNSNDPISELEKLIREHTDRYEANCKKFTTCCHCGELCADSFNVSKELWSSAGLKQTDGIIHLFCFEQRIGRQLEVLKDFTQVPANRSAFVWYARGLDDGYEMGRAPLAKKTS